MTNGIRIAALGALATTIVLGPAGPPSAQAAPPVKAPAAPGPQEQCVEREISGSKQDPTGHANKAQFQLCAWTDGNQLDVYATGVACQRNVSGSWDAYGNCHPKSLEWSLKKAGKTVAGNRHKRDYPGPGSYALKAYIDLEGMRRESDGSSSHSRVAGKVSSDVDFTVAPPELRAPAPATRSNSSQR